MFTRTLSDPPGPSLWMFAAYFGLAGSRGYFDGALPLKGGRAQNRNGCLTWSQSADPPHGRLLDFSFKPRAIFPVWPFDDCAATC